MLCFRIRFYRSLIYIEVDPSVVMITDPDPDWIMLKWNLFQNLAKIGQINLKYILTLNPWVSFTIRYNPKHCLPVLLYQMWVLLILLDYDLFLEKFYLTHLPGGLCEGGDGQWTGWEEGADQDPSADTPGMDFFASELSSFREYIRQICRWKQTWVPLQLPFYTSCYRYYL